MNNYYLFFTLPVTETEGEGQVVNDNSEEQLEAAAEDEENEEAQDEGRHISVKF